MTKKTNGSGGTKNPAKKKTAPKKPQQQEPNPVNWLMVVSDVAKYLDGLNSVGSIPNQDVLSSHLKLLGAIQNEIIKVHNIKVEK